MNLLKFLKITAIVAALALSASCSKAPDPSKFSYDIQLQVERLLAANETTKAEQLLKDRIQDPTVVGVEYLKADLFKLYLKLDLAKAEQYLRIAGFDDKATDALGYDLALELIGKDDRKALLYLKDAVEVRRVRAEKATGDTRCIYVAVAVEAYRNLGAAYRNLRNQVGVRTAWQGALDLFKASPECKGRNSYLDEMYGWLN